MKSYSRTKAVPSTMQKIENGNITSSQISGGGSVESLNVLQPGTVSGNFRTATRFAYERVLGTGLRGQTSRIDSTNSGFNGYFLRSGGYQSPLQSNSRVGNIPYDTGKAYYVALSKLDERMRGNLDLSIDFFQGKQMLRSAERVFKLTKTFSDSYRRATKTSGPVKELANLYLEWTYGIEPSLKDILETYELIFKKGYSDEGLLHFRGRGGFVERKIWSYFLNIFTPDVNVSSLFASEISVRSQIDVYLSPRRTDLQKLSHYTSMNPIGWLYEMMPYSFVLDWFIDLGGYMRNLETAIVHADRFVGGCLTYSVAEETVLRDTTASWGVYRFTSAGGRHLYHLYDRYPLTAFPLPKAPIWNPSLGSRRILNAAALLSQFLPDMFSKEHGRIRNNGRILVRGRN